MPTAQLLPAALGDAAFTPERMPTLFVGHGSPMNALEDTPYSRSWRAVGALLPKPRAILCVSAHWMTQGRMLVHTGAHPRTIHDFRGFPDALFAMEYPAPGAPDVAAEVMALTNGAVEPDTRWGLDHGAWSVLVHMYPEADVPVLQLSLDLASTPEALAALAARLKSLREAGVMILASGNLVHNLSAIYPGHAPLSWAAEFDARMAQAIEARDIRTLMEAPARDPMFTHAHPSPEHFLPALFPLAAVDEADRLYMFNTTLDMGTLAMRSFIFG